jgi:hypothetical protein
MQQVQTKISWYVCAVWSWSALFAILSEHILTFFPKNNELFGQN